ncbi:hypothetical protein ACF0H5_023527 [Mactra antiquata]
MELRGKFTESILKFMSDNFGLFPGLSRSYAILKIGQIVCLFMITKLKLVIAAMSVPVFGILVCPIFQQLRQESTETSLQRRDGHVDLFCSDDLTWSYGPLIVCL